MSDVLQYAHSQIKSVTDGRVEVIIYQQSLTAMNNVRELQRSSV